MAGAPLDENRMNVGVPLAQPHLPQRQLGPELCARSDSQKTAPRVPSLIQNTDERAPYCIKKGNFPPTRIQVHFYPGQQETQFYQVVFYFFSPPAISRKSHLQVSVCFICHSSLLLCQPLWRSLFHPGR